MESSEQSDSTVTGSEVHVSSDSDSVNDQTHSTRFPSCGEKCWKLGTVVENSQLYSPLDIPLRLGWKRWVELAVDSGRWSDIYLQVN